MKVLIIRLSSIGDIVLTTPVIRCLKQQLPGVKIHYLTKQAFQPVLAANPYIDTLHLVQASLKDSIPELQAEHFDYVIDLHHNLRTRRIKTKLGVKSWSFNKLNIEKWLLVNFNINRLPAVHIVDRYLDTVKHLGVKNDGKGLDYFLQKEHLAEDLLPESHRNGFTGIVIGAQHFTKRMPVEKLAELCRLIQTPIVLLGGTQDEERGNEISLASGNHVLNTCGKLSLDESAFLVKLAEKIITHDTGLMHIAAAFDKPIISIWGNTIPEFGMYPYKVSNSTIAEVKGLSCRPCSKIGHKKCPKGHFKCMYEIDLLRIANLVNT